MAVKKFSTSIVGSALTLALIVVAPAPALAHCDGLDGPVVKAAQAALEARNPRLVLIWVLPKDEPEIQAAFEQTLAVRGLSAPAKALADRFFFETVVRVHRAGEGEPYTGLKPAGRDLGPAIPAADAALKAGSPDAVIALLTDTMRTHLREQFSGANAAKDFKASDLAAGREYVRAYVQFIHYVERLYDAATTSTHGHLDQVEPPHRR